MKAFTEKVQANKPSTLYLGEFAHTCPSGSFGGQNSEFDKTESCVEYIGYFDDILYYILPFYADYMSSIQSFRENKRKNDISTVGWRTDRPQRLPRTASVTDSAAAAAS